MSFFSDVDKLVAQFERQKKQVRAALEEADWSLRARWWMGKWVVQPKSSRCGLSTPEEFEIRGTVDEVVAELKHRTPGGRRRDESR